MVNFDHGNFKMVNFSDEKIIGGALKVTFNHKEFKGGAYKNLPFNLPKR